MTKDNRDETTALVELGSVSGDTRGIDGPYWETGGLDRLPGLSQD